MKEKIIEIIEGLTDYSGIDSSIDLLEEDIIDSLAFIELIAELEKTFNIEIQPTQVPSDTWRNVDNIEKMVKNLLNFKK